MIYYFEYIFNFKGKYIMGNDNLEEIASNVYQYLYDEMVHHYAPPIKCKLIKEAIEKLNDDEKKWVGERVMFAFSELKKEPKKSKRK